MELYQKMDHWLYPLCMAGIVTVFHAGKSIAQMCSNNNRQSTLAFMVLAVLLCLRHFRSVSISFSPFLTSIELQEMITSSQLIQQWSNECQITEHTDEVFIIAYPHPDWQTVPFLAIASIQTVKLLSSWNLECQTWFHKHIIVLLCELWWILSSAV